MNYQKKNDSVISIDEGVGTGVAIAGGIILAILGGLTWLSIPIIVLKNVNKKYIEKYREGARNAISVYEKANSDCIPFNKFNAKYYKLKGMNDDIDYDNEIEKPAKTVRDMLKIGNCFAAVFNLNNKVSFSYIYTIDNNGDTTTYKINFGFDKSFSSSKHKEYYMFCMMFDAGFRNRQFDNFIKETENKYKEE